MLDDLTRDGFAENVNTTFTVRHGQSHTIDMELVEVSELSAMGRHRIYSILFRGPLEKPLYQGIYRMEHARLGVFDLFIVPVGMEHDGVRYEAVFNKLVEM